MLLTMTGEGALRRVFAGVFAFIFVVTVVLSLLGLHYRWSGETRFFAALALAALLGWISCIKH